MNINTGTNLNQQSLNMQKKLITKKDKPQELKVGLRPENKTESGESVMASAPRPRRADKVYSNKLLLRI